MFLLKIPGFVSTSMIGNVPTSCQKYPVLSPLTLLKNFLMCSQKYSVSCCKHGWKMSRPRCSPAFLPRFNTSDEALQLLMWKSASIFVMWTWRVHGSVYIYTYHFAWAGWNQINWQNFQKSCNIGYDDVFKRVNQEPKSENVVCNQLRIFSLSSVGRKLFSRWHQLKESCEEFKWFCSVAQLNRLSSPH